MTLRDNLCENQARAAEQLVRLIVQNNNKLTTGFTGTPFLCLMLSQIGQNKLAYDLLLNEDYPGWLYEVKLGATTVWERWNSLDQDGRISSTGMNSLNHYAYGSIVEWLWRVAAGLNPVPNVPGFREVEIKPELSLKLRKMDAVYESPCGTYRIFWEVMDNRHVHMKLTIPFGTRASVHLPKAAAIDRPELGPCVDGRYLLRYGNYEIQYETKEPIQPVHTLQDPIRELMQDNDSLQAIRQVLPGFYVPPQCLDMTIPELFEEFHIFFPDDMPKRLAEALDSLVQIGQEESE